MSHDMYVQFISLSTHWTEKAFSFRLHYWSLGFLHGLILLILWNNRSKEKITYVPSNLNHSLILCNTYGIISLNKFIIQNLCKRQGKFDMVCLCGSGPKNWIGPAAYLCRWTLSSLVSICNWNWFSHLYYKYRDWSLFSFPNYLIWSFFSVTLVREFPFGLNSCQWLSTLLDHGRQKHVGVQFFVLFCFALFFVFPQDMESLLPICTANIIVHWITWTRTMESLAV